MTRYDGANMGRLGQNCIQKWIPKWFTVAIMGVLLACTTLVSAQTTRPAVSIPQGKYENDAISLGSLNGAGRSSTTQPTLSLVAPAQLDLWRVALALAIVLSLIFTMRWAGRKFFPSAGVPRTSGAMKILSRLIISPKQQLLMIQVGRRIVVVGDAAGQMSPLSEITDPDEAAALMLQLAEEKSQTTMKGFGSLFQRAEVTFDEKTLEAEEKPPVVDAPPAADPAIESARGEIGELADKIRHLSAQFNGK